MRKNFKLLILLVSFFGSVFIHSQTKMQRTKIISNYDQEKNIELKTFLANQQELRLLRIDNYIKTISPADLVKLDVDNIRDIAYNGTPMFYGSHNSSSANTIRANRLYSNGSLGLNLSGLNMIAGVWEASSGYPLTTHLDLTGRVTIIDSDGVSTFHATHVTGTIISSGAQTFFDQGRGIAYQASVLAATSNNDYFEMANEASNGLLVSNHSYGFIADALPIANFGKYTFTDSYQVDLIINNNPYYLPVISAGNDRNNIPAINPTKGGYDLLTGQSLAKNALTSAATNAVTFYNSASDVVMSSFSNWGPADDGRIKPDISSQGVGVFSTSHQSNTSYGNSDGTSMSAPAITGLLLLLQEHYNNINNQFMLAASAKGLLLHTADEAGFFQGPDYSFGWGLANGEKAAQVISNNGVSSYISETDLTQGTSEIIDILANGNEPLQVSLSWTDPVPDFGFFNPVYDSTIDVNTSLLVNDLDSKITHNGVEYFPWKLDYNNPSSPATRNSSNEVDNFEKIEIDNPIANDTYTLEITHKNSLSGGNQNYTLIITGGVPSNLGLNDNDLFNNINLYPNPAKDYFNLNFGISNNSDITVNIYDINARLVNEKVFNNYNNSVFNERFQTADLAKGIYMVKVSNGNRTTTKKLVIN